MSLYKDGLIGLAVGEAFGVQLDNEDMNIKTPIVDMCEFRAYDVESGLYSDDTVSVLVVMDSFIHTKEIDYNDIALKYCDWINNGTYGSCEYLFDISKTVRFALMDYWSNRDYTLNGKTEEQKQDASFITRMYSIAIMASEKKINDDELYNICKNMTIITHNNETSILGSFITLKYLIYILNGNDSKQALSSVKRYKYEKYFNEDIINKYERILKNNIKNYKLSDINNDSYVVNVLESAFWILLNTTNYKDAIISSCALGNANGVRSSIIGLFAGIVYGKKSIPKNWLDTLKRKDYLEKTLRKYLTVI